MLLIIAKLLEFIFSKKNLVILVLVLVKVRLKTLTMY